MRNRLYVGNTPYQVSRQDIEGFFQGFQVEDVKIVTDRDTGRPRGFCFVELAPDADAQAAITKLDGQELGGRRVVVNLAKEPERRPSANYNGGGRGGRRDGGSRRRERDDY